jgi:hypothetical protein
MKTLITCPECGGLASFSSHFLCYKCSSCTWQGNLVEEADILSAENKVTLQDWVDVNTDLTLVPPLRELNGDRNWNMNTWRVYGYAGSADQVIAAGKTRWEALYNAKKQIDAWETGNSNS